MSRNNKIAVQVLGLCVAAVMIIYGVSRGETAIIFNKAVNICLECIGLKIDGVSRREAMTNDNMQIMKNILKI